MNHEKQRFTSRVQFFTSPGFGDFGEWRMRKGLSGSGPSRVITGVGVF